MISEAIERYPLANFDYDGHIAVFLQTSAVYLDVNTGHAKAHSKKAWQPGSGTVSQEAQHA